MKRKNDDISLILLVLMILGSAWFYPKLPTQMKSPFGQTFVVNNKLIFMIIGLGIMLLLTIVAQFPMTVSNSKNSIRIATAQMIMRVINSVYFAFYFIFFAFNLGVTLNFNKIIIVLVSFLMIFIGNKLPQIKFQSYIGFKMPWVMKDESCWRATHRVLGFTAIPFGILQMILVFVFTQWWYALAFGIGAWFIIGLIYSLVFFVKHNG